MCYGKTERFREMKKNKDYSPEISYVFLVFTGLLYDPLIELPAMKKYVSIRVLCRIRILCY